VDIQQSKKPENFYLTGNYYDPWRGMKEYSELKENELEPITLFGKPGLYTDSHLYREGIPEGMFAYDIEEGEEGGLLNVRECVSCYFGGTLLVFEELDIQYPWYMAINDCLNWVH